MRIRAVWLVVVIGLMARSVGAAPLTVAYTDASGREWASLIGTTGLSWNQIAAVCATDGVTACTAAVGAVQLTGWTWATPEQVRDVFIEIGSPFLTHANFDDLFEEQADTTFAPLIIGTFGSLLPQGTDDNFLGWTAAVSGKPCGFLPLSPVCGAVALGNDTIGPGGNDVVSLQESRPADHSESVVGAFFSRPSSSPVVPEPATLSLVGLGLVGAALSRRRRG